MREFDFAEKIPITKGWSEDKKYRVTTKDGEQYFLRVSPMNQYEHKKAEFKLMRRITSLGVPICQPIEFGTCENGGIASVYSLHSWIDGIDAEKAVPDMSEMEQYRYGINAGKILKAIHSIPAPAAQEEWEERFNRKIDKKIKIYTESKIKYNGSAFIKYINNNRHLLKNRPQCFQHGDYHIGNMMIEHGKLTIIDFNRHDYGDPWEEFNRIVWSAQASKHFASGIINGYFGGKVPVEFWRLLALYISSNTLSSVPWAITFGQSEVDTMLRQTKEVLEWYDNMKNYIPTWYIEYKPQKCFCGHECNRCITYLATLYNDKNLKKQAQEFYKAEFKLNIPLSEIHCLGGRSDEIFKLCRDCPWMKCCRKRDIDFCSECEEYPCKPLANYLIKYVNKHNQIN